MSRRRAAALVCTAGLAVLAACGTGSGAPEPIGAGHSSTSASRTPAASSGDTDSTVPTQYDERADARADIRAAVTSSKRDGKPVLLDFGADWCPDCRVLEDLYHRPRVRGALSSYHLVLVNVGQFDTNLDVARAHGVDLRRSGIPALAVVKGGTTVYRSNHGEFANARTMRPAEVRTFLERWS